MELRFALDNKYYKANLNDPIDISIPLVPNGLNPNCFYAPPFEAMPVRYEQFVGSIEEGGILNFKNLRLNPHGNGTHTECVGHIWPGDHFIKKAIQVFHIPSELVSVHPELMPDGDRVITKKSLEMVLEYETAGIIIRSLPNHPEKLVFEYSGTNPPYLEQEAVFFLKNRRCRHLLVDLPSIDPEEDAGKLLAHKAFWGVPDNLQINDTITEMVYIPNSVQDGLYLLNLQTGPFELDVSPSRPVIYHANAE